ncbi:hypothetical protein [Kineococcus gypseus]|uniref:hypothetical protein n=1 Tax=Kineococcus gypseus TaxID=1637102 RepID=UPI003D7E24A1
MALHARTTARTARTARTATALGAVASAAALSLVAAAPASAWSPGDPVYRHTVSLTSHYQVTQNNWVRPDATASSLRSTFVKFTNWDNGSYARTLTSDCAENTQSRTFFNNVHEVGTDGAISVDLVEWLSTDACDGVHPYSDATIRRINGVVVQAGQSRHVPVTVVGAGGDSTVTDVFVKNTAERVG